MLFFILFCFVLFCFPYCKVIKYFGELSSFVIPVWQGEGIQSLKYSTFLSIFILLFFTHFLCVTHFYVLKQSTDTLLAWAGEGYLLRETSVLVIHLASKPLESGHLIMKCFGDISN